VSFTIYGACALEIAESAASVTLGAWAVVSPNNVVSLNFFMMSSVMMTSPLVYSRTNHVTVLTAAGNAEK